jgi:hypothetical protein
MTIDRGRYWEYILFSALLVLGFLFSEQFLILFQVDGLLKHALSIVVAVAIAILWYGLPLIVSKWLAWSAPQARKALTFFYLPLFPLTLFSSTRIASLGVSILILLPILAFCSIYVLRTTDLGKTNWATVTTMALFCGFLSMNLVPSVDRLINSLIPVVRHPMATYDDKMTSTWGDFYQFMAFLRDNTPRNATILAPPSNIQYGNREFFGPYVEYFLYPRNVQHLPPIICGDGSTSMAMIVVYSSGASWPPDLQVDRVKWFKRGEVGMIYPCSQGNSQ